MLRRTGERSPFSMFTFSIFATGTGPNAGAVVDAVRQAAIAGFARLEIRDAGDVLDTIAIGFEHVGRPAWRFLGSDGTVTGPGSHELARYDEGIDTAAARLMHHAHTRAHQVRRLDRPVPWIYHFEPSAPCPTDYAKALAEQQRREELERTLGSQSLAQMFDDMRHQLARIAVALGRSQDGTGLDCDWYDLAGDVETLATEAPFRIRRDTPPAPPEPEEELRLVRVGDHLHIDCAGAVPPPGKVRIEDNRVAPSRPERHYRDGMPD
jgi:hypothetical protein